MKVLITSGGTTEFIDDVRVLTNISSGKLGARIAHAFADHTLHYLRQNETFVPERAHSVTYVRPDHAKMPEQKDVLGNHLKFSHISVTDVASLMKVMEEEVPKHDIIIHAMAVSDFGFKRDKAVKLKSNDPEAFIEYMRQNIVTNPKVISYIKKWNPNCKLVGFKFEVGKTEQELVDLALHSIDTNGCDLVVTNDLEEMKREKEHIAYLIQKTFPSWTSKKACGKDEIAKFLVEYFS